MKKLLTIATAAGMLAFIACGPSAEDKAKADKMKADSMHMADSMKAAQAATMMKMKQDSMSAKMKADSAAHMADSSKAKGAK
jgi:hypothetical protein